MSDALLIPEWSAPASVRACVTLRGGGFSSGPWGGVDGTRGWNLGAHCGDDPRDVACNRGLLQRHLPTTPIWLEQVHGTTVFDADAVEAPLVPPVADAAVTSLRQRVLAILTADCLSVVLANRTGTVVGIAHAGWRGLCAGVLEATVEAMRGKTADHDWRAWLGPSIGPAAFEVGDEVRAAFVRQDPDAAAGFTPGGRPGKWFGNLPWLARRRLLSSGVADIAGGQWCTVSTPERFYSYRRDRETGRMASLVWIA